VTEPDSLVYVANPAPEISGVVLDLFALVLSQDLPFELQPPVFTPLMLTLPQVTLPPVMLP
jgi:hypothetical protein